MIIEEKNSLCFPSGEKIIQGLGLGFECSLSPQVCYGYGLGVARGSVYGEGDGHICYIYGTGYGNADSTGFGSGHASGGGSSDGIGR
jgi:hypothetical protein